MAGRRCDENPAMKRVHLTTGVRLPLAMVFAVAMLFGITRFVPDEGWWYLLRVALGLFTGVVWLAIMKSADKEHD